MKRFFSTGVALGVGLSTLAGISEAQYFGTPTGNGLYPNPQFAAHPGVSFRQVAAPLRIGGNYPHVAQQGLGLPNGVGAAMGHQHVQMPGVGLSNPMSVMGQPQAFGNPTLAPSQPMQQMQPGVMHAGPMTITPSYTAPLPPVNNSATQYAGAEQIQPIPMNSSQFNGSPYSSQQSQSVPQSQQNIDNVPSTHASAYGSYGTVPSAGLYQGQDGSSCGTCSADGSCGESFGVNPYLAGPVAVSPWIFGASGLIFQRIDNDSVRLSTDANNPRPPYLTTYDARMETAGGYELMGGRYFGCGQYAILGSYWSILPSDETRTVYGGGTTGVSLYTNLPFNFTPGAGTTPYGITMPGNDAYFWYNNAQAHQITRGSEFQNVELNFFSFALGGAARQGYAGGGGCGLGGCGGGWSNGRFGRAGYSGIGRHGGHGHGFGGCQSCGSGGCNECAQPSCAMPCTGPTNACGPIVGSMCSPLRFAWFGGVRWFQFSDDLQYATSQDDAIIGNGTDFYYRNNVVNDLVGFQLGGLANYCCGSRLSLYAGTKFGVFYNRTQFDTFAGNSTAAATVQNGPYAGQAYNLMTTENNVAFLGEGEVGGRVRVTNGWSATCGYRLLGVTGVATAPGQIPYDFSRIDDASDIKTNDSLLLHGITIGALYNW